MSPKRWMIVALAIFLAIEFLFPVFATILGNFGHWSPTVSNQGLAIANTFMASTLGLISIACIWAAVAHQEQDLLIVVMAAGALIFVAALRMAMENPWQFLDGAAYSLGLTGGAALLYWTWLKANAQKFDSTMSSE